ncbi:hypothetical protein FACS1894170_02580 [Planctomycetales bacterium]|nr:hypothetical protein FACS1894170_02580 [Planctomycetales bacterium]
MVKPDDPMLQNADEAVKTKFFELQQKMVQLSMSIWGEQMDKLITPEQKQKIQEFQLATMSEVPIVSSKMFNVLGLSEEQQQKMSAIQKELDPQFNQYSDDFANSIPLYMNKLLDTVEQDTSPTATIAEIQEKMKTARKELEQDGEFQKLLQDLYAKGKGFVVQVKFKMFDVLTDEQMKKLQDLVDNPPDYVKDFLAVFP